MNDIIKAMEERRSIRKFKADMPSKNDIDQIIEAGLYAASGMGRQNVIIVAITNKKQRDEPVILVVLAPKDSPIRIYDGSLVMGNMLLAAHSLGLGSIWIHRAKEEFETDKYKQLLKKLGVEGEWEGIGHCAVGFIDGDRPQAAPRKPNRVFYVD